MKQRIIIAALEKAGFELREGGNHILVYKDGIRVSVVPRHRDINEKTAKAISKQTGVKF